MKKLLVLALMATLLMAGSAFAVQRNFAAAPNATYATGSPATTNNDDSCDISVAPAATLLLPYFEVESTQGRQTTLFTITNTSEFPQIAHVTVWSEYSIPVLDFNIFLTGYDVQGINLYDVIFGGQVATSLYTTTPGAISGTNDSNANAAESTCAILPGALPGPLVTTVQTALTTGAYTGTGCTGAGAIGGNHPGVARGYVTIDVADNCSISLPTDAAYFSGEILFDNVLIGDYQQLGPLPCAGTSVGCTAAAGATGFDGVGNPMVHIRAIPEGGPSPGSLTTNLPFTFYDRYTPTTNRQIDRRQPLPSSFAARYIQSTTLGLSTNYKIWREGKSDGTCGTGQTPATLNNSSNYVTEVVRFDEQENPFFAGGSTICSPCLGTVTSLPEAALVSTTNSVFPQFTTSAAANAAGGWMYLNLHNGGATTTRVGPGMGGGAVYSVRQTGPGAPITGLLAGAAAPTTQTNVGPRPSQNWVIVEMFGNIGANRLAVDFDAAWLGNGCSPAAPQAVVGSGAGSGNIGPAPNETP